MSDSNVRKINLQIKKKISLLSTTTLLLIKKDLHRQNWIVKDKTEKELLNTMISAELNERNKQKI